MFIVDNRRYRRHGYHCWRWNERQEQNSPSSRSAAAAALTDTYRAKDWPSPVLSLINNCFDSFSYTRHPIEHHSRDNRFFWSQIHRAERWREKQLPDLHCWSSHQVISQQTVQCLSHGYQQSERSFNILVWAGAKKFMMMMTDQWRSLTLSLSLHTHTQTQTHWRILFNERSNVFHLLICP